MLQHWGSKWLKVGPICLLLVALGYYFTYHFGVQVYTAGLKVSIVYILGSPGQGIPCDLLSQASHNDLHAQAEGL